MNSNTIDQQIQQRIQSFVAELSTLVRQAAVEAVRSALTGQGAAAPAAPAKRGPGRPRKASAAAAPAAKAAAPKAKRGKRSTADVDATAGKLVEYIAKNPGQSIEQIGKGMNIHTKHLKLPAKKLLEDKKLKTTGQRRGTKYFVK
jgi:hypothetical protein